MALVLGQVFHGPFYAPTYVARGLSFFEDEGLDVETRIAKQSSAIIDSMLSAEADIVVTGPARLYENTDQGLPRQVACIGQVTATSFFFLISRHVGVPFDLAHLEGKGLLLFPGTPTPWLCLQHMMRERGCRPDRVRRIKLPSPQLAIGAYARGEADYIELSEPYVDVLLEQCGPQRVVALGPMLGRCPFSVFVASRKAIETDPLPYARFLRAIGRAQGHLRTNSAEDVSAAITKYFQEFQRKTITAAIHRYQEIDLWGDAPSISSSEFGRLYAVLTGRLAPGNLFQQWVVADLC